MVFLALEHCWVRGGVGI